MDGGAFLLLLIAIVLGLAKWGQVHQAKKNKKTLLTASGDTERLEIKEDGSTQLVDGTLTERWSRNFEPVVKVDRMMKVTIQNEATKEPFARV